MHTSNAMLYHYATIDNWEAIENLRNYLLTCLLKSSALIECNISNYRQTNRAHMQRVFMRNSAPCFSRRHECNEWLELWFDLQRPTEERVAKHEDIISVHLSGWEGLSAIAGDILLYARPSSSVLFLPDPARLMKHMSSVMLACHNARRCLSWRKRFCRNRAFCTYEFKFGYGQEGISCNVQEIWILQKWFILWCCNHNLFRFVLGCCQGVAVFFYVVMQFAVLALLHKLGVMNYGLKF